MKNLKNGKVAMMKFLGLWSMHNEDKLICENVHDSLKKKQVDTIIGKYEKRIELFRKKMSKIITAEG